jgi:EmrB/QacA subfamily drug resistance transporter
MAALGLEARQRVTLAATVIGSSLAFIDGTVVIIALPTIERDLGLGLAGQQWVFLSYSLALAALYLVAGAVGDRFGRRRTFAAGAAGFALASALAGAAPTGEVLIAARTLQGVAGAFVTTNSLALLRGVYGDRAGRAIGIWSSMTAIATIAGPPVGGAIVEFTSWRWIFYVNLPLAAVTLLLARAGRCPEPAKVTVGRMDVRGAVLAAAGFGALTFALVEGAERGFGTLWWAFALAAGALAAFALVERRAAEPMLPFALFRRRNFAAANAETFLVYAALYGFFVYFTLHLQAIGFTPVEAGFANVPPSVAIALLAARFGGLADRHGPRLFLALAPALIGVGALLTLLVTSRSTFWTAGVAAIAVFSLGLAMLVAPITATALKSAPQHYAGVATGVNTTVSRLGSLLAVASIGLVVSLVFRAQTNDAAAEPLTTGLEGAALEASIDAYRAGMALAVALALAGAAVGALAISNRDARRGEEPVPEAAPAPAGS